ncbi:MAG: hypothetical protein JW750_02140 [Anaerolineaceae bacterium]|nr:hypothetical protein [Anaerolineaceae bacterium]
MSKQAEWMWYDGDFELYHHMKLSLSRRERGSIVPTFWKVFDCHRLVRFEKTVTLEQPEDISISVDGIGYLQIGRRRASIDAPIHLDAGEHHLVIIVGNQDGIPAALVEGDTIISDDSWYGDAFEGSKRYVGSMLLPAGMTPTGFSLPTERLDYVSSEVTGSGIVYDFGRETFIKLVMDIPAPGCAVRVVYGESYEEVMSDEHAVIREERDHVSGTLVIRGTACRYVRVVSEFDPQDVYGLYEYLPLTNHGAFHSSDDLINQIYDISEYTLRLNSRLFYLDGIKRDHWVWGGDAYQSFFLDYYSHNDLGIIQRTLKALRGGDPIVSHVNTILDYSLYWLIGLGDYSLFTGDHKFVRRIFDRAVQLMEFCETRETEEGLIQGKPGDWTFVDWADMEKNGALACVQMLYCKAFESMARCAEISEQPETAARYTAKASALRAKIKDIYWSAEQGAYVTTYDNGVKSTQIRRHANIFALIFGFADMAMSQQIIQNVILNDEVPAITTPYFKFYELEGLCRAGQMEAVTDVMRSYWGAMLELGATTFWEEFNPKQSGVDHYGMYGQAFDRSLCHAWGASSIYLLGRYYLGVYPTKDGYEEFEVCPNNGGLEQISGTVPVQDGFVTVVSDGQTATITTDRSGGWFVAGGQHLPIIPGKENQFTL